MERDSSLEFMRYEISDHGWAAIRPMLPNKPRVCPDHCRVLNGIFPRPAQQLLAGIKHAGLPSFSSTKSSCVMHHVPSISFGKFKV